MKPISQIVKELKIKPHQLHLWEQRGWLGIDPVLKDPQRNNQRVYNAEQIKRIDFIVVELEQQKKEGFTRTDMRRMEEKLLDAFGGLSKLPREELSIAMLPSTADEWLQFFQMQTKGMVEVQEIVNEVLQEQAATRQYVTEIESRLLEEIKLLRKEKAEKEAENELFKAKLDRAIEYIQKQEELEQVSRRKKSFWSSFFSK